VKFSPRAAVGSFANLSPRPARFADPSLPDRNACSKRYGSRIEDEEHIVARGLLLWLLGVPLSVIVLIALFTNFI
jgi:hypothetical protein